MRYPFSGGFAFQPPGILDRIRTRYDTWRVTARERRNHQSVEIAAAGDIVPLGEGELPAIFLVRNDMALLPTFLRHYRALGVTRFICVDDVSSDGSAEYLMDQPDVDVWTSPLRYKEARRGRRWREALFDRYGAGRWYLNIDSDEFLVYAQSSERTLPAVIAVLEARRIKRLPAPMLDFYPGSRSDDSTVAGMPWDVVDRFDTEGYDVARLKRGISARGGPRRRLFGEDNELVKYPLIYWDRSCRLGSSIHFPLPYERNFAPIWGMLLHFKFFTNYADKIAEAAADGQHYNGSQHYLAMKQQLDETDAIDFVGESSARYRGPEQLVELGFMPPIDFGAIGER